MCIAEPGRIERPVMKFVNSSKVEVMWKAPENPGGRIDEYQVRVEVSDQEENVTAPEILNCTGNSNLSKYADIFLDKS